MKILLRSDGSDGRDDMKAEVADGELWIANAKELAWDYANYTGSPITVVEEDGRRVLTVSIEYHDE